MHLKQTLVAASSQPRGGDDSASFLHGLYKCVIRPGGSTMVDQNDRSRVEIHGLPVLPVPGALDDYVDVVVAYIECKFPESRLFALSPLIAILVICQY